MMKDKEQEQKKRMEVQVHLLYSFFLYCTHGDFENKIETLRDIFRKEACRELIFEESIPYEEPCRSLLLKIPCYRILTKKEPNPKDIQDILSSFKLGNLSLQCKKITCVAKLFFSGLGTFRITLDLECTELKFSNPGESKYVSPETQDMVDFLNGLRSKREFLEIFENQIERLKRALGKGYYWLEKDKIKDAGTLENPMVMAEVKEEDKVRKIKENYMEEFKKNGEIKLPWQVPYLLVYFKRDDFDYSDSVVEERELEAILLLNKTPTDDTSFLLCKENGKLVDMFPSRREFCYLGRDLTLLIGSSQERERIEEEDIYYLLEICELLHLYCYIYCIANHILDGEIAHIGKAMADIRSKLPARGRKLVEVMGRARNFTANWFDVKVILTRFLEEPIIHRSVGKYARVYTQGVEFFKLREFKKALVDKIGLLSRLYDDMMEQIRLEQYIERLQ